ncbi:hypothetical protein A5715_08355 [Mycolicibacter heraklionensis]|nr:hypothetical protein A5715_08355 [Mycolicibacter heraklionensis]
MATEATAGTAELGERYRATVALVAPAAAAVMARAPFMVRMGSMTRNYGVAGAAGAVTVAPAAPPAMDS